MPLIVGKEAVPRLNCLYRIHHQHDLEGTRRVAKSYRGLPAERKEDAQLLENRAFDIALLAGFGITREDSGANQYLYLISRARKGSLAAKALLKNVAGEPMLKLSDLGNIGTFGNERETPHQVVSALQVNSFLFDLLAEEGIKFSVTDTFVFPATYADAENILLILNFVMHDMSSGDLMFLPVDGSGSDSSWMITCRFRHLYLQESIGSFYQKGKYPIIPPGIPHYYDIAEGTSVSHPIRQTAMAIVVGSEPYDD